MAIPVPKPIYEPHPAGMFQAVCVDVIDRGVQATPWGKKHQLRLVFETNALKESGEPWFLSRTFTNSLGAKSALREIIEGWRGKELNDQEISSLSNDIEVMKGKPCAIFVKHKTKPDGRTFGNIALVSPPDAKNPHRPSGLYVRREEKPQQQSPGSPMDAGTMVEDEGEE